MKSDVTISLNKAALYAKSQLFIRRSLERKNTKDNEEFMLWASLSLELLGKSALANIHPSLIVDPQHYQSLFAAAGISTTTDIKTITAKTLFQRLQHIIEPFDKKVKEFCDQVTYRRNAELHSGEVPFAAINVNNWEAEFWYTTDIILRHMEETLESWLGADDAATPKEILAKTNEAKSLSIKARVERARTLFQGESKARKDAAHERGKTYDIDDYPNLSNLTDEYTDWKIDCPSCGAIGFMFGEQAGEESIDTEIDEFGVWEYVVQEFVGEKFFCQVCSLKLDGYDELKFAGLDIHHEKPGEREMEYEPDYGND